MKLTTQFGVDTDTVARALRQAEVTLRPRRRWTLSRFQTPTGINQVTTGPR
jgi:DNA-binding transcriptional MocR family regulator